MRKKARWMFAAGGLLLLALVGCGQADNSGVEADEVTEMTTEILSGQETSATEQEIPAEETTEQQTRKWTPPAGSTVDKSGTVYDEDGTVIGNMNGNSHEALPGTLG